MRREARGGAGARKSLCLALISILVFGAGGCRRTAAPAASRYVRLDALLPLHPAWAQIEALNRLSAGFSAPNGEIASRVSPLPPPFPFVQTTPENLAKERQKRIREDADEYLRQLKAALLVDNAQRLDREVRARKRQADAQYRRELQAHIAALAKEAETKRSALNAQIYRLGFTRVAYESQARVFSGPTQAAAQKRVLELRDQIAQLTAQRDKIPTDFRSPATEQLKARYAELMRGVSDFQQQRATELLSELQEQIADRSQQFETEARTMEALGKNLPATPATEPVPEPAPPDAAASLRAAQPDIAAALAQQRTASDAQRERFLAVIRADTEKAVQQIAEREGWRLVPVGANRASDATDEVAKALRSQWQPQAKP